MEWIRKLQKVEMAGRCKSAFFVVTSLTVVWFLILLLCLPQQEQLHDYVRNSNIPEHLSLKGGKTHNRWRSPKKPSHLRYFDAYKSPLAKLTDTLFYQFDLYAKDTSNETIDRSEHIELTKELETTSTSTDFYVKSRGYEQFAFNLLASNRIGLHRPIPDTRNERCKKAHHDYKNDSKVKTSIIICYYNEAPSALLRTIHSILRRTPHELLQEILIVDDYSEEDYNYKRVEQYVDSSLVKMVRTNEREGLIRARLYGARMATGDILVFLDSHVETNVGWLEPLISTIQNNRTDIACPMIDLINADSLVYSASPMVKGGLHWNLNFKWDSVPSANLKTYDDFIKPIESPTMAGGLYAINRNFFIHLGEYDDGMELWGGENVELSLRTWMCGGRILILPCSRVGHIFRKKRPYGPKPDQPDSLLINSHRTARVWLDDYIANFYDASPDTRYLISGDVTARIRLRHKLGCHNFSWYLDNVYPRLKEELQEPNAIMIDTAKNRHNLFSVEAARNDRNAGWKFDIDDLKMNILTRRMLKHQSLRQSSEYLPNKIAQFQIQTVGSDLCIESNDRYLPTSFKTLKLNRCAEANLNSQGGLIISNSTILNQLWTETEIHDYRLGDKQCLDLGKNLPILKDCHNMGTFQTWTHSSQTRNTSIYNPAGGLCLGVERLLIGEPIIVTLCDIGTPTEQDIPNMLKRVPLRHLQPLRKWNLVLVNQIINHHGLEPENEKQ